MTHLADWQIADLAAAQHRREQMQARAFEIADEAMFDALNSYASPITSDGLVWALVSDYPGVVVHKLAEACPELREAVEWLRDREFVQVASDERRHVGRAAERRGVA